MSPLSFGRGDYFSKLWEPTFGPLFVLKKIMVRYVLAEISYQIGSYTGAVLPDAKLDRAIHRQVFSMICFGPVLSCYVYCTGAVVRQPDQFLCC